MDLKFKGTGKWIGSMYHKFEAMCHEVDEFVTKVKFCSSRFLGAKMPAFRADTKVQTVKESVRNFCSDVLHDFHPPPVDCVQPKEQAATEKQDGATGSSIWSTVDVDGMSSHSNEIQSPEEGTVDCTSFNSSAVNSLRQNCLSHCAGFPEDEESSSHWKKDTETAFPKTTETVKKDIRVENYGDASYLSYPKDSIPSENYGDASYLSYPKDIIPSDLLISSLEQHQITTNVESSDNGNIRLQSEIPTSRDKISMDGSSKNTIEDLELRISQEEKTKCNKSDLSENPEAWFSSDEIDNTLVWNDSDWVAEEHVMVEHPDFENVSCSEDKNLYQFLWVKEQTPVASDLFSPVDKTTACSSLAEEDPTSATLVRQLPETLVPDERISCTSMTEKMMDGYADPSEELKTILSSGHGGMGIEISLTKEHQLVSSKMVPEHQLVSSKMVPKCTRSSEFSVHLSEQHRSNAEVSSEDGESLPKITPTSTNKNFVDKFIAESSLSGECLRILEDKEGGDCRRCFSEEAETDLSLNNDQSWELSELSHEDNGLLQKHAVMKYSGCLEDLSDLSVHSRYLHMGIEGTDSPKNDSSSKSSLRSEAEEHITTVAPNFVPMATDQSTRLRALYKDVSTPTKSCNVLSSNSAPSDNFSPKVYSAHHVVAAEESSSYSSTEFSRTSHNERAEKMCYDCTTSSCSTSDLSSMSPLMFSALVSDDKIETRIPSSSMAASSADIEDDLSGDTVDTNLVTIDLSDKEKLDGSHSAVDDELFSIPSFRPRKYRSYKELIKEAFASRNRLVKEYKQLPIWYGDFDNANTGLPEKHLLPPPASPSASESTLASPHSHNIGESDWELL
ncbi:OLC1v1023194C1 [Oldenlandia corymbosa var. corymbosa]|uniref:OLC1v1023194C1 n=1 Tax=Oldenlandia corymbosa var. corymbosa TaxID=529605 RepID=A0AAV1C1T8_OLDCO|nr:OLC1v1023194C1 [Oldenlandia corymbosa var. corymbosa]